VRPLAREASGGLADALITAAEGCGDDGFILIELIHGAAHRIPDDSAAFGGRRAVANVTALSIWREVDGDEAGIEWGRRAARSFEPYSLSGGGYLNYPEVDQTAARVAAAFGPERFAKLREIKRTWDPDNRFRHKREYPAGLIGSHTHSLRARHAGPERPPRDPNDEDVACWSRHNGSATIAR
jgi:FAD/FMN-containing dehydrogenase